jgi:flagellar assembly factor FliW
MALMKICTSRFGSVEFEPEDVIQFPAGILGLDGSSQWVLLADAQNDCLGWLQSANQSDVALAVVSPRRFVSDYQVRVARDEIGLIQLDQVQDAQVLVIVSKNERTVTLNLKAPLVINLARRLGRQVVNNADLPLQYELPCDQPLRKNVA